MDYIRGAGPVMASSLSDAALSLPLHHLREDLSPNGSLDVPTGFPTSLAGKSVWTGASFKQAHEAICHLTDTDQAELCSAKDHFNAQGLDGDLVNRDNFPLPTLGPKLEQLVRDIYEGQGFCVVRGINPNDYSVEDLTIIWLGVQAYIADQRGCQDDRGNMLVHIIADNSTEAKLGHHRHSTSAISFHNEEAGDVVSWLTRSTASTGGRCILAPVHTIYNILAAHRPDMIRTLAKSDWPVALPHFQCRPLLFYHDSKLMMNFGRTPLLGNATHPRPEHLPKLNERQHEALDTVEAIAQAIQLEVQTQAGDMHFINNFTVLHRREGFVDGAAAEEKRHLVRMRLRSSQLGWAIPEGLQREWAEAFETDNCKVWHLDPMPGDAFPLRKYTN
ncbi:Uu.00g038500.m01.CDS01 [Anthostomella pinea]|uniref:Uu.00g038500.m01.CDS01 n=1 Tax=Anthostomella pinea TaxID=933095 RepID=A0AAI8VAH0_9PEZI|nr:Uu.00g038500.m01.CDS01 [Anthostomella pinea]